MYNKAYGIIETLAPLHIGASAGEETGNMNLIFRDQFTQTGIIPGSSIRGRFRSDMREVSRDLANDCYGREAEKGNPNSTTEAQVKFEYASLVWLPVFCPGQPVVWITCPRLLKRYQQITKLPLGELPKPYQVKLQKPRKVLFFNLGFLKNLKSVENLSDWIPKGLQSIPDNLVVVQDKDISIIHEMALYRQTRTKLEDDIKKVENFFGLEALPEGSILVFPVAVKEKKNSEEFQWKEALKYTEDETIEKWKFICVDYSEPKSDENSQDQVEQKSKKRFPLVSKELYFGGLESIGFGRCHVTLSGNYFKEENQS